MVKIEESIKYRINDKDVFSINDFLTVTMESGEIIKGKVTDVWENSMEITSNNFGGVDVDFENISEIQIQVGEQ